MYSCQRGNAQIAGTFSRHENNGGGPVVQWAGIPGGDSAAFDKGRLQTRQFLQRSVAAWTFVDLHHASVWQGYRDNFFFKDAAVGSSQRPVMATQGKGILFGSTDM